MQEYGPLAKIARGNLHNGFSTVLLVIPVALNRSKWLAGGVVSLGFSVTVQDQIVLDGEARFGRTAGLPDYRAESSDRTNAAPAAGWSP